MFRAKIGGGPPIMIVFTAIFLRAVFTNQVPLGLYGELSALDLNKCDSFMAYIFARYVAKMMVVCEHNDLTRF